MIHGGHFKDYPKPYKLRFDGSGNEKRDIKIASRVWGVQDMGNGHHHAHITEENNAILLDTNQINKVLNWKDHNGDWCEPYRVDYGEPLYEEYESLIHGRRDDNGDYIKADDVKKWAEGVLKEWGVTDITHTIRWDLDDDDPLADVILAREMRKRNIRND